MSTHIHNDDHPKSGGRMYVIFNGNKAMSSGLAQNVNAAFVWDCEDCAKAVATAYAAEHKMLPSLLKVVEFIPTGRTVEL